MSQTANPPGELTTVVAERLFTALRVAHGHRTQHNARLMLQWAKDQTRRLLVRLDLVPSREPPFLMRRYQYREADRMRAALGLDLARPVRWDVEESTVPPSGDLERIFFDTKDVHKWLHYMPVYERALAGLRAKRGRFLEIGVWHGGSLAMWRRYFDSATVIVGVDIDSTCKRFEDRSKNVHVRIGSQDDVAFLRSVVSEFGPFDAILDDGSHRSSHMVETFKFLFANGLADGGVYIVEDVHCDYWTSHRDSHLSFAEFTKCLIDSMHAHYHDLPAHGEGRFRIDYDDRRQSFDVLLATVLLEKIEINDSIVVVSRANGRRPVPRTACR